MTVNTSAGVKFYVGPVAGSDVDTQGEFEALSYTLVGEVESIGEFGDAANPINFTALNDRRVRKFKGSFDAGNASLALGRDISDAGQAALVAARATDFDYAFKVLFNDGSAGSPSQGSVQYFRGKVMGYTTNVGGAEDVTRSSVDIAINSPIVEVAAV